MAESLRDLDGQDLDLIISDLFSNDNVVPMPRRETAAVENRMDSALANLIENKIQTKALPLALRKRLMYQRAVGG